MTRPKHIFFDLDHTLWDYETNSIETIRELLVSFQAQMGREITFDEFYPIYYAHNHDLWVRYRKNEIDNLTLRYQRWRMAFADFGIEAAAWMDRMGEAFLEECPRKTALMPNAIELLDLVSTQFPLHIITNGFAEIQDIKLDCSGLRHYFDVIVTPDVVGEKKPHPKIFHEALQAANCSPEHALYIGDSYTEDMLGGSAVGMQVVYFNPKAKENPDGFREVQDLIELTDHLSFG
ncbi:MAG: YjjG family noncanonical pyrimidine nucleotidase [Bacteroidia bacterium]|nr:YjjG family noncanonical pyrimidine nucleotidase [Bacteroidia bacterium]